MDADEGWTWEGLGGREEGREGGVGAWKVDDEEGETDGRAGSKGAEGEDAGGVVEEEKTMLANSWEGRGGS